MGVEGVCLHVLTSKIWLIGGWDRITMVVAERNTERDEEEDEVIKRGKWERSGNARNER